MSSRTDSKGGSTFRKSHSRPSKDTAQRKSSGERFAERMNDHDPNPLVYGRDGKITNPKTPEEIRRKLEWGNAMNYFLATGDDRVIDAIHKRD